MSFSRPQRHRADSNQADLVKVFIKLGGLWIPRANKPFDGWAWHQSFGYMPVEIKDPRREGHANEYTPAQVKTMKAMRLVGAKWLVWRVEQDVIDTVQLALIAQMSR